MRIQFVLPSLHLTGGVRVVFEHARRLRARGHDVALLAPPTGLPPGLAARLRLSALKHFLYERFSGRLDDGLRRYGLRDAVARFSPSRLDLASSADVTVATAWETAEWVHAMPARVGRKYYLIQNYEAWTEALRPRVDATWRLPLRKIVIAGWLQRLAHERFGDAACARIPNGVDAEHFRPGPPPAPGAPPCVGMIYDLASWKGASDGAEALQRIHARAPGTKFMLLGRARLRHAVPTGTRYFRDPLQAELPRAYQAADVFCSSSLLEGFSLVTLEAMACGCALVATAVGEAPEMGRPGEEYLLVPASDPGAMADAVLGLLGDPGRLAAVRRAGRELALKYGWDRATDQLEAALAPP